MRLFLDTSVILAACGSATGASRLILEFAGVNGWTMLSSRYGLAEVVRNLADFGQAAIAAWPRIQSRLDLTDDVLVIDRPAVFTVGKDRPILFTAYKYADVLLTLDRQDFIRAIGARFYHLEILTPGAFVKRERGAGRLRIV